MVIGRLSSEFLKKLAATRKALKCWAAQTFRGTKKHLDMSKWFIRMLDKWEELRSLSTREFKLRISLRERVYELLIRREKKWKQRNGVHWLREGDKNTKFFHAAANARRAANSINCLLTDNGVIDGDTQILQTFHFFYKDLLGSSNTDDQPFDLSGRVGDPQNLVTLQEPLMRAEINRAVTSLPNDKAAGPDGRLLF